MTDKKLDLMMVILNDTLPIPDWQPEPCAGKDLLEHGVSPQRVRSLARFEKFAQLGDDRPSPTGPPQLMDDEEEDGTFQGYQKLASKIYGQPARGMQEKPVRTRGPTRKTNQLDMAAEILAQYIDETSTKAAEVFLSRGAPFAADVSQDDLLEYYRAQLFNPDGNPNYAGRTAQIQRLGAEGFARLFKQVTGIKRDESVPPQPESVPVPVPIPAPPPMPMPMPMPGVGSGG